MTRVTMELSKTILGFKNYLKRLFRSEVPKPIVVLSMTGALLDSLFLYIKVIHPPALYMLTLPVLDHTLGIQASVFRTVNDFVYIIYFIRLTNWRLSDLRTNWRPRDGRYSQRIWITFLVILIILPIPQVSQFGYWRKNPTALAALQMVCRMIPVVVWTLKAITSGKFLEWLAIFCFYTIICSQITGAIWYNAALSTEIKCQLQACESSRNGTTDCNIYSYKFFGMASKFCSENYGFGMFEEAHRSGIFLYANGARSWWRILYCFRWGLQNLSSFGQNIEAGVDIWRNIFTITLIVFGMLLFSFLIGLFQSYLHSYMKRSDARERKLLGTNRCRPFLNLSKDLKLQIEKYKQDNWQKINIVNLENMFNNLPEGLRRELTRELCLGLLKKVDEFRTWHEELLLELCDCINPVFYVKRTRIIREGDPIDEMIFVVHGKLWTYRKSCIPSTADNWNNRNTQHPLKDGDFHGKELVNWLKVDPHTSHLPISEITIQAVTDVEAFVLTAYDLKNILIKRGDAPEAITTNTSQW